MGQKCIADLIQAQRQSLHCPNSETYGFRGRWQFQYEFMGDFLTVSIFQKKKELMSFAENKRQMLYQKYDERKSMKWSCREKEIYQLGNGIKLVGSTNILLTNPDPGK